MKNVYGARGNVIANAKGALLDVDLFEGFGAGATNTPFYNDLRRQGGFVLGREFFNLLEAKEVALDVPCEVGPHQELSMPLQLCGGCVSSGAAGEGGDLGSGEATQLQREESGGQFDDSEDEAPPRLSFSSLSRRDRSVLSIPGVQQETPFRQEVAADPGKEAFQCGLDLEPTEGHGMVDEAVGGEGTQGTPQKRRGDRQEDFVLPGVQRRRQDKAGGPAQVVELGEWEDLYNQRSLNPVLVEGIKEAMRLALNKEQTYELSTLKLAPLGLQKPTLRTRAQRLKPEEWKDELVGEYYYYAVCGDHYAAAARSLLGSEVAKRYNFERWPARMVYFSDDDFKGYFLVSSQDNKKDLKAPPRQLKRSMKDIRWKWKHDGCPKAVMGNPSGKQDQVRDWRKFCTTAHHKAPHNSLWILANQKEEEAIKKQNVALPSYFPLAMDGQNVWKLAVEFFEKLETGRLLSLDGAKWIMKKKKVKNVKPGVACVDNDKLGRKEVVYNVPVGPPTKKGKKEKEEGDWFVQVPDADVHYWKAMESLTDNEKCRILKKVLACEVVWTDVFEIPFIPCDWSQVAPERQGSVYGDMERNSTQFVGLMDFLSKKGEGVVFFGKPHVRSVWDLLKAGRHVVAMEGNSDLLQFTMQVVKSEVNSGGHNCEFMVVKSTRDRVWSNKTDMWFNLSERKRKKIYDFLFLPLRLPHELEDVSRKAAVAVLRGVRGAAEGVVDWKVPPPSGPDGSSGGGSTGGGGNGGGGAVGGKGIPPSGEGGSHGRNTTPGGSGGVAGFAVDWPPSIGAWPERMTQSVDLPTSSVGSAREMLAALVTIGSRSGGKLKSAGIRTTSDEEPPERSRLQSRSGSGEPSQDPEIGSIVARDGKVSPERERRPQGLQRDTETTKSAEIRTSSGGGCRPRIVVLPRGAACTEMEGRSSGFNTGVGSSRTQRSSKYPEHILRKVPGSTTKYKDMLKASGVDVEIGKEYTVVIEECLSPFAPEKGTYPRSVSRGQAMYEKYLATHHAPGDIA
ncbi:hypothetical protein CBR_g37796 [Chara braunii]|uniref:Uncharacterized protein n=1 Tax=Chara braunii TaxID=69332 RepID=A0A388LNW5_CHABU|nr:hypothetical protein CBR_g37796 [Chara braunii]|eukprot:GBG83925.1 hypothetical protein CBR_g37796 [Chara braunii]